MGLFDRLRKRFGKRADAPAVETPAGSGAEETTSTSTSTSTPTSTPTSTSSPDLRLERLSRVGVLDGPDEHEALALLRELRETPFEAAALAALTTAAARKPLGDDLAAAAAKACVDRGEIAAARAFLQNTTNPDALLLAADLAEEAGELPTALALVERVLARAYEAPGARERHARLATALGRKVTPSATASSDGTVLSAHVESPYALRREIARGGAAAVYEAEDRELARRVALKVYHDASAGRDQLLHEARVATELASVNVIRVFDVDVRGGWLVLEHFPLGSLREWIRTRPAEAAAFTWLPSLVSALAAVHARGYVHLDVKPGNVLLRSTRDIVLADFGTARRAGEASPPGSLGYVSPERIAGARASTLDDAYGIGRIVEDVLATLPARPARLSVLAARLTAPAPKRIGNLDALFAEIADLSTNGEPVVR